MPETTDVAIVGGGVIGCSIAYYLSRKGISTVVFEQGRLGSAASGATAGMFSPLWHSNRESDATLSLGLRSLEMIPRLAAELREMGVDPQFRQSGILKLAMTPQEAEILQRDLIWQGELGLGVGWLEPDEVRRREPEVNSAVLGGVLSPREGYLVGQRFVDALAHAAGQRGAVFMERAEVLGLETDGQRTLGVRTSNDTFHARHTVLAAGPWTGVAGRWVPDSVPVRPVKGQRALLRKLGFLPKGPVLSFAGTVIPQADGNVLIGATRHEGEFDEEITAEAVRQIIADAVSSFPLLEDATFVGARAGVRPGSADDVPIIGRVPGWEGLIVASGHDACGIMLSPGTGELVADYIASEDAGPLEPFSLTRFGTQGS